MAWTMVFVLELVGVIVLIRGAGPLVERHVELSGLLAGCSPALYLNKREHSTLRNVLNAMQCVRRSQNDEMCT